MRIRCPLFRLRFPIEEIPVWAERYQPTASVEAEEMIEQQIALAVRKRGWYTRDEFLTVCRWKSARSAQRQSLNTGRFIHGATAAALAAGDDETRAGAMRMLRGVEWPTASVLLHFGRTDTPILEFRALWSLSIDPPPPQYTYNFWRCYRRYCSLLARRVGISMRILDRALWQYSKSEQPTKSKLPLPFSPSEVSQIVASQADKRNRLWLRPNRTVVGYDRNYEYSLTIDGYGYIEEVWGIDDPIGQEAWDRMASHELPDGRWRGSFANLRCCLFKLQRSIRWIEGSCHATKLRQQYDRCYVATCDAWDAEHPNHLEDVALAHHT